VLTAGAVAAASDEHCLTRTHIAQCWGCCAYLKGFGRFQNAKWGSEPLCRVLVVMTSQSEIVGYELVVGPRLEIPSAQSSPGFWRAGTL
jgi:hypothetical protein